jgi:cytochrome b pre-mRNA-processing protein 3
VLTWIRARSRLGITAAGLYGSIVAQARDPSFYALAGVPDTMEGRFGVIAAHMFLVLERIRQEGDRGEPLARALLETFMTDMDDSMREIGIGDMGVPRRVKKAAAALEEQVTAYRATLTSSTDDALADAIRAYIFLGNRDIGRPDLIAAYLRRTSRYLATQSPDDVGAGRIAFEPLG